jgi:hypothetical protein
MRAEEWEFGPPSSVLVPPSFAIPTLKPKGAIATPTIAPFVIIRKSEEQKSIPHWRSTIILALNLPDSRLRTNEAIQLRFKESSIRH